MIDDRTPAERARARFVVWLNSSYARRDIRVALIGCTALAAGFLATFWTATTPEGLWLWMWLRGEV